MAPSTLYGWIKQHRENDCNTSGSNKNNSNWTTEERFNMLLETSSLTEEQQGAYCRHKGIYQHQLAQWKDDFMKQNPETKHLKATAELKVLRAENKALKKDLNRKNKALAETSALLILKKKASLIWGDPEAG